MKKYNDFMHSYPEQALKNGNSAFIDQDWNAYPNQWQQLQNVKKLSKEFIEKKINEWSEDGVLGTLADFGDIDGEEEEGKSRANIDSLAAGQTELNSRSQHVTSIRRMLKDLGERHDSGVKITLLTLPADGYPKERIEKTKELLAELTELGATVMEKPGIHEHFAVIDREIVWYGSVNLLSNAKEEDNLMRVKSKEIAQELLEIGVTDKAFAQYDNVTVDP